MFWVYTNIHVLQQKELCSLLCAADELTFIQKHNTFTSFTSLTSEGSHMRQLPDNSLLIKNVKREDAGTYECRAQIRGRPIFQNLSVSVVINGQYLFYIKMK